MTTAALYGAHAVAAATTWEKVTSAAAASNVFRTVTVVYWNPDAVGGTPAVVQIATSTDNTDGASITPVQINIEPGKPLQGKERREVTKHILLTGEHVWVKSDTVGVCVEVRGVNGDNT